MRPVQRTAAGPAAVGGDASSGPRDPCSPPALRRTGPTTPASASGATSRAVTLGRVGESEPAAPPVAPDPAARHGGPRGHGHARRPAADPGTGVGRGRPAIHGAPPAARRPRQPRPDSHRPRRLLAARASPDRPRQRHAARAAGPGRTVSRWAEIGVTPRRRHRRSAGRAALLPRRGPARRRRRRGRHHRIAPAAPRRDPRRSAPVDRCVAPRGPGGAIASPGASAVGAAAPGEPPAAAAGGSAVRLGGPARASSADGPAFASPAAPPSATRPLPILPVSRRPDAPGATLGPPRRAGIPGPASASGRHARAGIRGPDRRAGIRGRIPGRRGSAISSRLPRCAPPVAASAPRHRPSRPRPCRRRCAAAGPRTLIRPTMGLRPLRTGVTAQRERPRGPVRDPADAASVPARWPSGDDLPATVRSLAPSADSAPRPPLCRCSVSPTCPRPRTPAGPAPAMPREIVFPPRDASTAVA